MEIDFTIRHLQPKSLFCGSVVCGFGSALWLLMSDHWREEGSGVLTGSQIGPARDYTGLVPGYARKNPASEIAEEL